MTVSGTQRTTRTIVIGAVTVMSGLLLFSACGPGTESGTSSGSSSSSGYSSPPSGAYPTEPPSTDYGSDYEYDYDDSYVNPGDSGGYPDGETTEPDYPADTGGSAPGCSDSGYIGSCDWVNDISEDNMWDSYSDRIDSW